MEKNMLKSGEYFSLFSCFSQKFSWKKKSTKKQNPIKRRMYPLDQTYKNVIYPEKIPKKFLIQSKIMKKSQEQKEKMLLKNLFFFFFTVSHILLQNKILTKQLSWNFFSPWNQEKKKIPSTDEKENDPRKSFYPPVLEF